MAELGARQVEASHLVEIRKLGGEGREVSEQVQLLKAEGKLKISSRGWCRNVRPRCDVPTGVLWIRRR